MGRAYRKVLKKGSTFGAFPASRSFHFRVAGVGTSWHSNMFQDASKVGFFFGGRRNTFATSSNDVLNFFCGRRSTLNVSCPRVFFESHCQRCAKW